MCGFFFFLISLLFVFLKACFFFPFHIMFVNGYSDRNCISESAQILMEAATETEEKLAISG